MTRALVVAVLSATLASCAAEPAMTREQARDFTRRALAGAGLTGVEVAPEVRLESCGQPPQESWRTTSRAAGGGTVELCVPLRGDRAVYVRDVGPGGVGPLLADAHVDWLERFEYDPVDARRRGDRVLAGSLAAALVVLVAYALLRLRRADRVGGSVGE